MVVRVLPTAQPTHPRLGQASHSSLENKHRVKIILFTRMKKKNFDPANEIFVDASSSTHSVPVPEVGLKLVCLPAEAHLALVLHAVQVLDVTNLLRDLNLAASCIYFATVSR